jgi:hypothetical protein
MRINENTGGVPGIAITPREGRPGTATGSTEGDSVALGFAAWYGEALRQPSPAAKSLEASVRDGSYNPEPLEIASALLGRAFAE